VPVSGVFASARDGRALPPAIRVVRFGVAASLVVALGALFFGCGKPARRVRGAEVRRAESGLCKEDEVREYSCDSLLPVESARPAEEPYGTCPSSIEVRDATFPPKAGTGDFDAARTEFVRRRSPPGQQCCYSWCGQLEVVEPAVVEDRCRQQLAFPESYCVTELESGTSGELAASPFERCAAAIKPPAASAFSVPPGAHLDRGLSAARRQGGESLCCYSWCSIAPPGTTFR
jgi:hypothetical protein